KIFMKKRLITLLAAIGIICTAPLKSEEAPPFLLNFSAKPGILASKKTPYMEQLQIAYDLGFRAWEDNKLLSQPVSVQEELGKFLKEKKMTMGVTVVSSGNGVCFFQATAEEEAVILDECRKAVELAKITNHQWFTLVPGNRAADVPLEEQLKGAVPLLQKMCDIFEPAGLIMVVEPLSHPVNNKPVLLETFEEGFQLCELVNRPSLKVLADYYHEQQMAGNLIKNTNDYWEQIAYIQFGDVPGRKQPFTGEINYVNVCKNLLEKGYKGPIGLEHGSTGGPEKVIEAYRRIDRELAEILKEAEKK
ncbi:MAG: TIM barrel protein, partial [Verrucomicrobiota bacterium]